MNTPSQIKAWLEMAFCEPVDRINESYYFDTRNQEFFSIFITDYFLTDPDSTEEIDSPYSIDEFTTLCERMDRLEENAACILFIPRLTVSERKEMMEGFLRTHALPDEPVLAAIMELENGRTALDFNRTLTPDKFQQWLVFKSGYVAEKADTFCNLNRIDLDAVSLWTDKKVTRTTIDLRDKKNTTKENRKKLKAPKTPKKPWWRFW